MRGQGHGYLFPFVTSVTNTQKVSAERIQVFHLKKGKLRLKDRVSKREN